MKRKKWILKNPSYKSDIFDIIAASRGFNPSDFKIDDYEKNLDFLDPYMLKGMVRSVERIYEAIRKDEKIYIYGDYDVDGISSVSILMICFLKLGIKANYYIPQRIEEGYGINKEALKKISEDGASLIISVDCGITSIEEVDYANDLKMDIIITDHHQCKAQLPKALSIINPKQPDCNYPFKELCGAGIAFKLAQALLSKKDIFDIYEILEIAAVATVADIVALTGENRTIVKNGLLSLEQSQNLGLKGLIDVSGITAGYVDSNSIAFILAPRINSSGRMGKADIGVSLLMSKTYKDAVYYSKKLEELNRERQSIELEIYEEALRIMDTKKENKILIAASDNWHSGVIGIVASKLTEKFHKPSIIIAIEEGIGKGSGRSVDGFNLFSVLSKIEYLLEKFGGHEQAAGITIKQEKICEFEDEINKLAEFYLNESLLYSKIIIDAELSKNDLTFDFLNNIAKLEPFGMGNSKPVFCMTNIIMKKTKLIGKTKKHLKGFLNSQVEIIGFNMDDKIKQIDFTKSVDIAFELNKNIYMGKQTLQLLLKDIKQSYLYNLDNLNFQTSLKNIKSMFSDVVLDTNRNLLNKSELSYINYDFFEAFENKKNVIIIFDYKKSYEFIKHMDFRGIKFSCEVNNHDNNDINTLIIMPIIDNLDLSIYNSIIICEDELNLFSLPVLYNKKIKILSNEIFDFDITLQNSGIPSREVMVKIYSLIFEKKHLITDIFSLCSFLNSSVFDFLIGIEILSDMNIIIYNFSDKGQKIDIKLADKISDQKKNIDSTKMSLAFKNYYKNIISSQGGTGIGIER